MHLRPKSLGRTRPHVASRRPAQVAAAEQGSKGGAADRWRMRAGARDVACRQRPAHGGQGRGAAGAPPGRGRQPTPEKRSRQTRRLPWGTSQHALHICVLDTLLHDDSGTNLVASLARWAGTRIMRCTLIRLQGHHGVAASTRYSTVTLLAQRRADCSERQLGLSPEPIDLL